MNIALVAHDKRKELMVEFCIAYSGILRKHDLFATSATGTCVEEATGLVVTKFLSGSQGGDQQICARIAYNEIDLVLFFNDPISKHSSEADIMPLIMACDANNVPIATNVATAEVLIMGLERGDLGWRDILRQTNKGA